MTVLWVVIAILVIAALLIGFFVYRARTRRGGVIATDLDRRKRSGHGGGG